MVCRFAAHHVEDPHAQFAEMARCVKPGGQLVVADLVADDDAAVARLQNELERRRDPSHAALLSTAQLRAGLEATGVTATHVDTSEVVRPLAPWLAQTGSSTAVGDEVRAALRREIEGGAATGLQPREQGGELWFVQRFASITACKRA